MRCYVFKCISLRTRNTASPLEPHVDGGGMRVVRDWQGGRDRNKTRKEDSEEVMLTMLFCDALSLFGLWVNCRIQNLRSW